MIFGSLNAISSSGGEETTTSSLLTTTENEFYDVAIIRHLDSAVEFLVYDGSRRWASFPHFTNVPTGSLRLSFAAKRAGSLGGLVIRSCSVELQEFR